MKIINESVSQNVKSYERASLKSLCSFFILSSLNLLIILKNKFDISYCKILNNARDSNVQEPNSWFKMS